MYKPQLQLGQCEKCKANDVSFDDVMPTMMTTPV